MELFILSLFRSESSARYWKHRAVRAAERAAGLDARGRQGAVLRRDSRYDRVSLRPVQRGRNGSCNGEPTNP